MTTPGNIRPGMRTTPELTALDQISISVARSSGRIRHLQFDRTCAHVGQNTPAESAARRKQAQTPTSPSVHLPEPIPPTSLAAVPHRYAFVMDPIERVLI